MKRLAKTLVTPIRSFTFCWQGGRVQLKRDGAWWRTGGEVKGKLANGVGSQYSSHYLGTWCIQHNYRWRADDWTEAPDDLNWLVRFAERRNLVPARVPSHFKRGLMTNRSTRRTIPTFVRPCRLRQRWWTLNRDQGGPTGRLPGAPTYKGH
jgi:hypothetical protein